MDRKDNLDSFGVTSLILFSLLLAFNQVIIKVVNEGLQPVFFAGVRSVGSAICVAVWIWFRGRKLEFNTRDILPGLVLGTFFGLEFLFLFLALDLTTVIRTSIIFYTMPVWLAIAAHFLLPGEKIGTAKVLGLVLAFSGVVLAILDRGTAGTANLLGDMAALAAAILWAGIPLTVRLTSLSKLRPEMQLLWQLSVSVPLLLLASLFLGPLIRDLQVIHLWGLAFQIVVISAGGFMFWLWLIAIYPATSVASFSFLSPVFGIALGWLMLGERAGLTLIGAGFLVVLGLYLINTKGFAEKPKINPNR